MSAKIAKEVKSWYLFCVHYGHVAKNLSSPVSRFLQFHLTQNHKTNVRIISGKITQKLI